MANAGRLVFKSDSLTEGVKNFPGDLDSTLRTTVDYFSPRVEAYAREHAPWTDQTGNARSGLHSEPFHEGDSHGIRIAHSVPYGIWLEVRWEGKYAIIVPTVKEMGKQLMQTLTNIFGKVT